MYNLLIVESPAKAKTINHYLGKDYKVIASFGHVRALLKKKGSIDVEHEFKPEFEIITRNKKHVDEILLLCENSNKVILATDPDREGEAIAWHIQEIIRSKKKFANLKLERVTFNQISKNAINSAIAKPRDLDINLIEAQLSRVALDYLIGFNISPLLWKKIKNKLSAGRVQSPALRLICEREKEIKEFVPMDYFKVMLHTEKEQIKLGARLVNYNDKKIDIKTITDKNEAIGICDHLSQYKHVKVIEIKKNQKNRNPNPPFMTSTLQIEASRKLGFNTEKTMKIAQSLYEGKKIKDEIIGLITYMRTDSVSLSDEAINDIRKYIGENFTQKYLPLKPNNYLTKVKNAQEAHEAIRPTSIFKIPNEIKEFISADEFKLYELIWLRTLSSQIASAIVNTTEINLQVDNAIFRLNGLTIAFDGYLKVYNEEIEENNQKKESSSEEVTLPDIKEGELLPIEEIKITDHKTEPKPRYSEALLVKKLEELGIGRPSTYASIISTLKAREYVLLDKKKFIPTDIGDIVNSFLTAHLTRYVDYKFTSDLEDKLDDISNGKAKKIPILKEFWDELSKTINEKSALSKSEIITEKLDENCPECSKPLNYKLGKYGKFIGCSGYPDCHYMKKKSDGVSEEINIEKEIVEGRFCPKDNGQLIVRKGKYGKFIACNNYPSCKYIESDNSNIEQLPEITCPECNTGNIIAKKGRFGLFYSCNSYPNCKTIFKHKPVNNKCKECNYALVLQKTSKTKGDIIYCPKCEVVQ